MFDLRLRSTKEHLLRPVGAYCPKFVSAGTTSLASFVLCVGAGLAAWRGAVVVSVACWLIGRTLDGLDGVIARSRGTASEFGGYSDLLLDTIGYAVVPLGIAFAVADTSTWQVVGILLGTFYVNAVSWLMLSALLEKRAVGVSSTGEQTSVTMPTGLIEGTETIVLFTVALAAPQYAHITFGVMAAGVGIGIAQRAVAAHRLLRTDA